MNLKTKMEESTLAYCRATGHSEDYDRANIYDYLESPQGQELLRWVAEQAFEAGRSRFAGEYEWSFADSYWAKFSGESK